MNRIIALLIFCMLVIVVNAVTITEWNFDTDSTLPSIGSGNLGLIGGVTSDGFNTGNPGRAWSTTSYPAQGTNNLTSGMYIEVSTLGHSDVTIAWNIRHSNTSANREAVYYTLDRTATTPLWELAGTFTTSTGDSWLASSFDGSSISGWDNNPNLAFKIVSSFANAENTQYMPSSPTGTYSGGKWRFDNIQVSGTALEPNLTISAALDTFYALVGGSSPVQSYSIEGVNLIADLVVTPPMFYRVRVSGDIDFQDSLILTPRSGSIALDLEVIYQPTSSGTHTGDITHSGGGLSVNQTLYVEGSTTKPEPTAYPTGFGASDVTYYQLYLNWIDSMGGVLPDGYVIKGSKVSSEDIVLPIDGVPETEKKLTKIVTYGTQAQLFFALDEYQDYFFRIFPYSNIGTAIDYKTDGSMPHYEVTTTAGPAGSDLQPGDIAFVEYASDSPDRFSFVLLTNILENTKIKFTDKAWTGTAFAETEETYIWRAVARAYNSGEVIHIEEGVLHSDEGVYSPDFSGFSNSGDQIIAYQGELLEPLIIGAFSTTNWITTGTPTNSSSYLPDILTLGVNALGFSTELDNGVYNGPTTGFADDLLAAMNNPANWTRNNSLANMTFPDWYVVILTSLSAPELSVNHPAENTAHLSWSEVPGANWYSVFSSENPNAVFPSGWTLVNPHITASYLDCDYTQEPQAQFYIIKAHH